MSLNFLLVIIFSLIEWLWSPSVESFKFRENAFYSIYFIEMDGCAPVYFLSSVQGDNEEWVSVDPLSLVVNGLRGRITGNFL